MAKRKVTVRKLSGQYRAVVQSTTSNKAEIEIKAPFPLHLGDVLFLDDGTGEVSR